MGKRKRGRCAKRNNNTVNEPENLVQAPHSFVIHKGLPGGYVLELTRDFRKVMEPFTATSLKERRKNTVKDFVSVAGLLHVTHLIAFTRTELGMYFKVCRLPRGPTLTFKVHNFSLAKDVISALRKQFVIGNAFKHPPLVILNGFGGAEVQMKLMATVFQNMFPKINLAQLHLNDIRRCLLLNYDPQTKLIDLRHYVIKVAPVGVSKSVRNIIAGRVPNLAKCEDIADFIIKSGVASESEMEDDPSAHVTLAQKMNARGVIQQGKSAIRLSELGPRLTLQIIKIEDGLMDGEVLFHDYIYKSEAERLEITQKREAKRKLKQKRRKVQEDNLKRKEEEKEELKQKSLKGMEKASVEATKLMRKAAREGNVNVDVPVEEEQDDDAEYYRQEVGEEPDKELFSGHSSATRMPKQFQRKKVRDPTKRTNKDDVRKSRKNKGDKINGKNRDYRQIGSGSKLNKLPGVRKGKVTKKYRRN